MTHKEKRIMFTRLLCQQVLDMFMAGYEVAFDEVTEKITSRDPSSDHIERSLHHEGLAADLNLYKDGAYLDRTEYHKPFGDMWKARHPYCKWGGDIKGKKVDGNHYSFTDDKRI